jgi:two-component system, NarL family, sensor histidine kinase FusK
VLSAVVAVAYFASARVGLSFATVAASVTLLWPPSGLALFVLLAFGIRLWPAVFAGALAVNAATGIAGGAAFGIAVGNCLEAIAGYYLLRAVGFQAQLPTVRDVFMLVALAAGLSTMAAATVGALMLVAFDIVAWDRFGQAWLTWWMGDAMGVLAFASLLLAWWCGADDRWTAARGAEAALLLLCLIAGSILIFAGCSLPGGWTHHQPLAFMTFPLLTWAALRFGMRGATAATVVIGTCALAGIVGGAGLFARASAIESLTLLWLYTNVLAVTGMVLAASVHERRQAEERFRHLAQHDVLTGLPNRITLQDQLTLAMHRADRHQHLVAILFVDLDRFKLVNDSLGHTVGDQLLGLAGARLRACVRRGDIVTRYGGDEFVILVDEVRRGEDVARVAD